MTHLSLSSTKGATVTHTHTHTEAEILTTPGTDTDVHVYIGPPCGGAQAESKAVAVSAEPGSRACQR